MRRGALILAFALTAPACAGPDHQPLPVRPGESTSHGDGPGGDTAEAGGGEGGSHTATGTAPVTDDALFRASRHGDAILPGVILLDPGWDATAARVEFTLRNDTDLDLADLVLAVVFVYPSADPAVPFRPRQETFEAPLRKGQSRRFSITLSRPESGPASSFRIVPGIPELLCPRDGEGAGTTFMGGRLECVGLRLDLTAAEPSVEVVLEPRDDKVAAMDIEARLFLVRHDRVVWAGPWVVLPRPAADGDGLRRLRWQLNDVERPAGSVPCLRVRRRP